MDLIPPAHPLRTPMPGRLCPDSIENIVLHEELTPLLLQDFSTARVALWALQQALRVSIPAYNRAVRRAGANGVFSIGDFVGILALSAG